MKHCHFIGIKGVGMTPLALIAKQAGFMVTGCDVAGEFITDVPLKKADIPVFSSFDSVHLNDVDLVITTAAHGGFDNPEVMHARKLGITVLSQGQALGEYMKGDIFGRLFEGISIAGCHGKTSTTAMVATLLRESKLDPSYVIGTSEIISLPAPGHYGQGECFIAEADEYVSEVTYDRKAKFFYQFPTFGVITNIEFDHPDVYSSIEEVKNAYLKFTDNISSDGVVIVNGDDPHTKEILPRIKKRVLTFGQEHTNDVLIHDISKANGLTMFHIRYEGEELEQFSLVVPGNHTIFNATVAIIIGKLLGLDTTNIRNGLLAFKGTRRRLEFIKTLTSGALLYDDYGHHPTEIKTSLTALKEHYPDRKLVCIFQPHTYSRTKQLFTDFLTAFSAADEVILAPIFASAREALDLSVSSDTLASEMQKKHLHVISLPDTINMIKYISEKKFGKEYILVTMGAGDIYKTADSLV